MKVLKYLPWLWFQVVEQRADGVWKGQLMTESGHLMGKTGYFPSSAVVLVDRQGKSKKRCLNSILDYLDCLYWHVQKFRQWKYCESFRIILSWLCMWLEMKIPNGFFFEWLISSWLFTAEFYNFGVSYDVSIWVCPKQFADSIVIRGCVKAEVGFGC